MERKNIYILIFVILTIVMGILAVKFYLDTKNLEKSLQEQNNNFETNDINKEEVNNKENEQTPNDNNELSTDNTDKNSNVAENEIVKEVPVAKIVTFDSTKSKDTFTQNGPIYREYTIDNGNTYKLIIYNNGEAKIKSPDVNTEETTIQGVNGKVVDGIFGRFSPGVIRIYLLLEDGTVQKYNFDYFEAGNFKADSAIENVKDIVKLETIINDGGKPLAIAIDKYGYYYTLN